VPVIGTFLFSILVKPIFQARYLIVTLPPLVMIAAYGLQQIRPAWLRHAALLLMIALCTRGLVRWYKDPAFLKEEWREAGRYVAQNALPTDGVLLTVSFTRIPFEHYLLKWSSNPAMLPQAAFSPIPWGERGSSSVGQPAPAQPYPRLWVVSHLYFTEPFKPISSWMPSRFSLDYCLLSEREFPKIRVTLYQRCLNAGS
jgi:hypothetical protein